MAISHLEFIVEEHSMEVFLMALLSRCLPDGCTFDVHSHKGKKALLQKLEGRLRGHTPRGYARSLPPDYCIVVIVDADQDDCQELKRQLEDACRQAGLKSRQAAGVHQWQAVTRIAIEELEAWYFGDWQAVCSAYPRIPQGISMRPNCKHPDAISGGTWEAFEKIMKQYRYCRKDSCLNKVQTAKDIGQHIDPERNRSPSFKVFWKAISEVTTA